MDLVFIFSRLFKWFCISIEEVSHLNVKNKKIEKSMLRIIARKNTFDNKLTFGAIVLTIIIAISLITGLFLIQIGNRTAEQKVLSQMQQVSIANLTTSKIEELQKNKLIEELVPYKSGFEILIDNKKIQAVYMPNNTEVIHTYRILKGNAPIDKNEVVINENLLQLLNKEIGDELEVSNNDGIFEKFIITGICENVSSTGSFFYVSQRYAEEGKLFTEIPYMALIRINNAEIMNIVEFENTIYDMADKYDIDRKEIYFNSKFLGSLGDESSFGMTFIYSFFIFGVSIIVIYSIFFLSVSNRVVQIGNLRLIGMTKKQVKSLIRMEGDICSLLGISIGVVVGLCFAIFIEPNGVNIVNISIVCTIIMIIGYLVVRISILTPSRIASSITPIENVKFLSFQDGKSFSSKSYSHLTAFTLAKKNIYRERKKKFLILVSLVISGVLFVVGVTFLNSWSEEEFARQGNLEQGEFYIGINHNTLINGKPYGISEYQIKTPFSDELIKNIADIPNVKNILIEKRTAGIIEYAGEDMEIPIIPITEENKAEVLDSLDDQWTYEELVEKNGMIILGTDVQKDVYHNCPIKGENLTFRWFDGQEHSDNIIIAGTSEKSFNEGFYLTPETIKKFWGDMDITASIILSVSDYKMNGDAVTQKLEKILLNHPDLVMQTLKETLKENADIIEKTRMQILGVSFFIIIFSWLNLICISMSSIATRRREFAMLEAIGMTKKQLKKMIMYENILLIILSIAVTLILGNGLGYVLVEALSKNGLSYFVYQLPCPHIIIYILLVLCVTICMVNAILKLQRKVSLVERIKID